MITFKDGDLLASDCTAICHQVNCKGVMGSGIAKQIKAKYPSVYTTYKTALNKYGAGDMFAHIQFCPIGESKYIVNMFSQYGYGYDGKQYTDYNALRACLKTMNQLLPGKSIALPYNLGCCRGGGDWNTVLQIIKDELVDCDVVIYKLNKG